MDRTDNVVCSLKEMGLAITEYLEDKTEENWRSAWALAAAMDDKENPGWDAMPTLEFLVGQWNKMPLPNDNR